MSTNGSGSEDGAKRKRRKWQLFVAVCVLSLLCCFGGCQVFKKVFKGMGDKPHMTKEQIAAFEARYQDKGATEQAANVLEDVIARTADEIVQLVPGLTWEWHDDRSPIGCPGDTQGDTWVMRIWARVALFSGPIPEDKWPEVKRLVSDAASGLGPGDDFKYHDSTENHDVSFLYGDGGVLRLGSAMNATLTGTTPCRLRERWYAERNIPVPGAI